MCVTFLLPSGIKGLSTNLVPEAVQVGAGHYLLTLYTPKPQNGQTHSDNLSTYAYEFFQCV